MHIELEEHQIELMARLLREQQQRLEVKPQSRLAVGLVAMYRIPAERLERALEQHQNGRARADC